MAASFHIPYDSTLANRHDLRHYAVVATCVNTALQLAISQALKALLPYLPSVRRLLYLHLQDEAEARPQDTLLGRLDLGKEGTALLRNAANHLPADTK